MTPLTVAEARAILVADEALDYSWPHREATGQILSSEEADAWNKLVESAKERIAACEGRQAHRAVDAQIELARAVAARDQCDLDIRGREEKA